MKVKFKKFDDKAVIPYKSHGDDFCYDCVATSCEEIAPNVFKYGLGFGLQIIRESVDDTLLSFDLRPRSSIYKTGCVLSNSCGTVDEGYTNEISAIFYKVADGEIYKVGDRVCQMKLGMTKPIDFVEVNELDNTKRGLGGFGSTGK